MGEFTATVAFGLSLLLRSTNTVSPAGPLVGRINNVSFVEGKASVQPSESIVSTFVTAALISSQVIWAGAASGLVWYGEYRHRVEEWTICKSSSIVTSEQSSCRYKWTLEKPTGWRFSQRYCHISTEESHADWAIILDCSLEWNRLSKNKNPSGREDMMDISHYYESTRQLVPWIKVQLI